MIVDANVLLHAFLPNELHPATLGIVREHAAYLTLAEQLGEPFVTADARLYDAVHPALERIIWLGDLGDKADHV